MLRCRRVSLAKPCYDQSYDVPPRAIGRGTGSIWNAALSYKQKPPRIIDDLVLSYVYSKQPILGLTQEWFRELSFSMLECGVHKLHISSADWWDLLLPLA